MRWNLQPDLGYENQTKFGRAYSNTDKHTFNEFPIKSGNLTLLSVVEHTYEERPLPVPSFFQTILLHHHTAQPLHPKNAENSPQKYASNNAAMSGHAAAGVNEC